MLRYLAASVAFLALTGETLFADEPSWPQFHGPNADSIVADADVPLTWSEDENIAWKTAIHDFGWSSPVILGDQIWCTTANETGTEMSVICIDRESGDIVHDILLFNDQEPTDTLLTNSFASPTPCVEEGRVYVHFGTYGTACLDSETGETIWERRDLNCEHLRGPGSSPLLDGDLLYLPFDGADVQYVIALDKNTGETIWKTDRSTDFGDMDGDLRKAYDTPLMIEVNGRRQLVCIGAQAAFAYDPADGSEIWRVLYRGYSNAARPVFDGTRVYISTGFGKASLMAVRPEGQGDVTETHVDWVVPRGIPLKPTPLALDGRLYCCGDDGIFSCLDAETGEAIWQKRLKDKFSATPLIIGDRVYCMGERGTTFVLQTGDEGVILAENVLDEGCMASPAVVGDELYVRTRTHLYRIEYAN